MNPIDALKQLIMNMPELSAPAVIAGGAVANTLYNHKHNHNAPINDIDIFVFYKRDVAIDTNTDGAEDNYVNDISSTENNLKILKTVRQGLFNIIDVEVDTLHSVSVLGTQLLNQFDINATQALMTVETNPQVITLKGFDQFLESRQLLCVNPNTPVKTMLRMLKKKKEFNCYLSDNHLLSIFQFARYNNQRMTEETVEKFKDQIEYCRKFFRVFRMKKIVKDKSTQKDMYVPIYKVFLKRDLYLKLHRNEKKLIRGTSKKHLMQVFELHYNKSKLYEKYLLIRPYKRVLDTFIDSDFNISLKSSFNADLCVVLEKHLRQTQVLSKYFMLLPVNDGLIQGQYLSTIKKHEKDFYSPFCGHLANITVPMKLEYVKDTFSKFKVELIANSTPLVDRVEVDEKYKDYVTELTCQFELSEESHKMTHCVSGYAHKIKMGLCRIFSIVTDEGNSTLEVGLSMVDGKVEFRGLQHRKECNKFPADKNRLVAKSLIHYLNTKECVLEIGDGLFDPTAGTLIEDVFDGRIINF